MFKEKTVRYKRKLFYFKTESMTVLDGHDDYVRCAEEWVGVGGQSESSNTWVTGCYDHAVRLWDARVGTNKKAITKKWCSSIVCSCLIDITTCFY